MANILFLFEGESTEEKYYKVIENSLDGRIRDDVKFYSYKTNIHVLYDELNNDENLDIIGILSERARRANDLINYQMLNNINFGEIYLIFDLDPQDDKYDDLKIRRMLEIFDNETENGKLYINYPMVESFKHFKSIPDEDYNLYKVSIQDCNTYKRDVASLSCINDYRKITKEQYFNIVNQNVSKSSFLINDDICCDFKTYKESITQENIYNVQDSKIKSTQEVYVLNTFCLWPLDYFSKDFFDDIIK